MAKEYEFEARVCISGSNGIALYIPTEIVKLTKLRKEKNRKVDCVVDEDGDIIIDMESFHDSDK